jgi:hypothetical protein
VTNFFVTCFFFGACQCYQSYSVLLYGGLLRWITCTDAIAREEVSFNYFFFIISSLFDDRKTR